MGICVILELIVHAIHRRFSPMLSTHELQITPGGPIRTVPTDESASSVAELGQVRIEYSAEPHNKSAEATSEAPSVTASSAPLDPTERHRASKPQKGDDKPKITVQHDQDSFFSGVPGKSRPPSLLPLHGLCASLPPPPPPQPRICPSSLPHRKPPTPCRRGR